MKKKYLISKLCVYAFCTVFYTASAFANIITLTAEGTVSDVGAGISSDFKTGDRAVYELIYDTSASNSLGNPAVYNTAISSFRVTVGTYTATSQSGLINVYDNFSSMDLFRVTSLTSDGLSGASVGGHALNRIFFQLWDLDQLWLDSVELPTSYLSADDYENKVFRVDFADNNILTGDLDTFTVGISQIPIPQAVWLFSSGLIGLIGMARRMKV